MTQGDIQSSTRVLLDLTQREQADENDAAPLSPQAKGSRRGMVQDTGGVDGLSVDYSDLRAHHEQAVALLVEGQSSACCVCTEDLGSRVTTALICPAEHCKAASHMACLAKKFQETEGSQESVLPTFGRCPRCDIELRWIELVKEMSLRAHGEKKVARILKKPQELKVKSSKYLGATVSENAEADKAPNDTIVFANRLTEQSLQALGAEDDPLPEQWHELVVGDDDISVTSVESDFSSNRRSPIRTKVQPRKMEVVIEDSEWDSAEVLD